jgi:hypothetical protein
MVIKDWYEKRGETLFEKYNRFLTEVVEDSVDCYVYSNHMISNEKVLVNLNSEQMYIKLVKREPDLVLDMLMFKNGVTSKVLFACEPEPFIIRHGSAELMVNHIFTFNQLGRSEEDCLAYAMHMLVKL